MDGVGREMRQAARRLTASPAFSLASLLTLALAIGANVAVFAVVQRVVLNPLPYPDSGSLLKLEHRVPRVSAPSFDSMPLGLYFLYVDRARSLEAMGIPVTDRSGRALR
jgi:putative ABC transport system permease protein